MFISPLHICKYTYHHDICAHIRTYIAIMYTYICIYIYVCKYMYTYIYIYICKYTETYTPDIHRIVLVIIINEHQHPIN